MRSRLRGIADFAIGAFVLACAASCLDCVPPWYWLSSVDVEGRFLPDGRCEATVRGDVARHFTAPADASDVGGYVVTCGDLSGKATDHSNLMFFVAGSGPSAGLAPGRYRITAEHQWSPPSAGGTAGFLATLDRDPANVVEWRDYRSVGGELTLTSVTPTGSRAARVTGAFHVRARRYLKFD